MSSLLCMKTLYYCWTDHSEHFKGSQAIVCVSNKFFMKILSAFLHNDLFYPENHTGTTPKNWQQHFSYSVMIIDGINNCCHDSI